MIRFRSHFRSSIACGPAPLPFFCVRVHTHRTKMVKWPPKRGTAVEVNTESGGDVAGDDHAGDVAGDDGLGDDGLGDAAGGDVHARAVRSHDTFMAWASLEKSCEPTSAPDCLPPHFAYERRSGNSYSLEEYVSLQAEGDIAHMQRLRWQDRGPGHWENPPAVWRGQPLRPSSGKYAKRGGKKMKEKKKRKAKFHVDPHSSLYGGRDDDRRDDDGGDSNGANNMRARASSVYTSSIQCW